MKTEKAYVSIKRALPNLFLIISIIALSLGGMGCSDKPISFSDRLISLVPSQGTLSPEFSTLKLLYNLNIDNDVDSITLTPTLVGESATVAVNGTLVNSGLASQQINVTDGSVITVDVTGDSNTFNYIITVVKARSANAFLSELTLSQGQLTPSLEANTVSASGYELTVPFLSSTIFITPTLADSNASLTINGITQISGEPSNSISLSEGDNIIDIIVTAENLIMQRTYRINVIRSSAEEFALYTYLKATNTEAGDSFGSGIAIWENRLVIGARYEDSSATEVGGDQSDNSNNGNGAAYLFEKNNDGEWIFINYLKPDPNDEFRLYDFGKAVAVSKDYIAIKSKRSSEFGQVHIFSKDSSNNWVQTEIINFIDGGYGSGFGDELILQNNLLFVGHPKDRNFAIDLNDPNASTYQNSGAVFIYQLGEGGSNSTSQEYTYIRRNDSKAFENFGASISVSGNTLAIGSTGVAPDLTGGVTIFTYNQETGWTQQAFIQAPNPRSFSQFGSSVSLSGERLVVGAEYRDIFNLQGSGSGAVYVFERDSSSNWIPQVTLTAIERVNVVGADQIGFGSSLFISGDTIIIGAKREDSSSVGIDGIEDPIVTKQLSGAAFIFTRDELNQWTQNHYIKTNNTDARDNFASDIVSYSDEIIFSAPNEDSIAEFNQGNESDNSAENAGAAYIYQNTPFTNHNLALTVVTNGSGNGSIVGINQDTGIALTDCENNCSQLVTRGQTVELTPVPSNGASQFDRWEGDQACFQEPNENGSILIEVLAEIYCKALFSEKDITLSLTKNASSNANGSLEATSNDVLLLTCDNECDIVISDPVELNTTIQITATAESGAFVAAWSGDEECQANATNLNTVTSVTMSSSKTCTALFSFPETSTLRLTVDNFDSATGFIAATNLSTGENLDECFTDCSEQIIQGHSIQLTALSNSNITEFLNWSGDNQCNDNANANITTVNTNTDVLCTAAFAEIVVEDIILSISKDNSSSAIGSIDAIDNDGNLVVSCDEACSSDDSAPLNSGTIISLTATPENGAIVTEWSGDAQCQANANDDNTITNITVSESLTCVAKFDIIQQEDILLSITKAASSTGDGLIEATDIDNAIIATCDVGCTTDTSSALDIDSLITLTAIPETGTEVTVWSGDSQCQANASGDNLSTNVTMSTSLTCTAQFDLLDSSTLRVIVANSSGSIGNVFMTNIDTGESFTACSDDCSEQITNGQTVSLFATPLNQSSQFSGWSGDPACTTNINPADTANVIVNVDTTCTANFTLADSGEINITISKADDQTGDGIIDAVIFDASLISCPVGCTSATSAEVDVDSFILLFATPDSLSSFVEWSGNAECSANASGTQTSVTLDVAKTCTAKFDFLPTR